MRGTETLPLGGAPKAAAEPAVIGLPAFPSSLPGPVPPPPLSVVRKMVTAAPCGSLRRMLNAWVWSVLSCVWFQLAERAEDRGKRHEAAWCRGRAISFGLLLEELTR